MKGQGLSRESRLLIDAARAGDDPSAADRKRVRAALARKLVVGAAAGAVAATATHAAAGGVVTVGTGGAAAGTGVGVAAGTAGGATAASLAGGAIASGFGAKVLVSVAIVGAMGAGTVGYVRHASKRADSHAVAAARPTAPTALTTTSVPPASARSGPVLSAPAGREDLRARALDALPPAPPDLAAQRSAPLAKSASAASSPASAAASAPSELDVELALLQDAHGALRMNDGARALRLLDEHARRFPNGTLAEESEAARVFALREVGRTNEARDVAARFLREHPRSPLAPRVTRAFDADAPTF